MKGSLLDNVRDVGELPEQSVIQTVIDFKWKFTKYFSTQKKTRN
jgi:hypothetical protein